MHGLENIATCQVDGGSLLKGEVYIGFIGRYKGMDHALHMATSHIVRLEFITRNILQSCLVRLNHTGHDNTWRDVTNTHQKELNQRDMYARNFRAQPEEERHEIEKDA